MAAAAALVALWITFAPCFLWTFLGAPSLARITSNLRLAGVVSAIMAAVVGVIANLSLWFALHFLFATVGTSTFGPFSIALPSAETLKPAALGLSLFSGALLLAFHQPMWRMLAHSAAASAVLSGL